MDLKLPALVRIHLATVLFGVAGLFAVSTGLNAVVITFGRTLFAALTLSMLVLLWQRRVSLAADISSLFSGLLLAVHWSLFFKSIQVSSVAIGLIMFTVSAVFIAILEPFWFRERSHPVMRPT